MKTNLIPTTHYYAWMGLGYGKFNVAILTCSNHTTHIIYLHLN